MSKSRISEAFHGKKAFAAYLMAGDPSLEKTRGYILALEAGGADVIEIGIPFSDPIAEGETIQGANLRAFAGGGAGLDGIFGMVKSLRGEVSVPLLFMSYVNPVFNYGYGAFFAKCADCGISGLIFPDLPFEEQGEVSGPMKAHGLDLITLVAPTSGADRIEKIAKSASGYVYLVSSTGVTGVRGEITTDIARMAGEIKKHTDVPVAVGFGIHSPRQAAELSKHADGIIVGSAIVNIIAEQGENTAPALTAYVRSMKAALG
ncbi:MAG: tryptophan synthase subunit alpha [Clostridiales Family XIII bacterium]|jgi:tryptophan synthase alpha chain|nr:tryptophan synthase subunit alpha [Clostridiales Family XIII bacterium]